MTQDYRLIRAARYLSVAPWELLKQPIYWVERAIDCENIDAEVEEARANQARAEANLNS